MWATCALQSGVGARRAAVGIAFAQHGVHGAAQHFAVALFYFLVGGRHGSFRVIRDIAALGLQFFDGRFELGHGSADVGQLDDIGFGIMGKLAQFG